MDKSELLRQSLARIQTLKARVAELEAAHAEPIAIVGIGLRFPGGLEDPRQFWAGLCEGVDVIREIPAQRWPEGAAETGFAGMLERVYEFEPSFFGLSEREARAMDPQQRLLLEVAYDGITDAGLSLHALRGSSTGVFVGASGFDWSLLAFAEADINGYMATGSSHAILANRLSYTWDLRGPSVSLDAACASSLVAVHLGVASLRRRECDRVIAGGVQAHLVPHTSLSLSRFGMMAADGRCKAFDSRADGFVRSEGAAVVVLARLSDVDLTRDRVYALIHGSAVNQDGRSNGLTAPNSLAQAEVLRAALANARVEPEQVGLIETHGTGTALGDPIEFQAIEKIYGAAQRRCYLGAVKTNLGHTEAAAGVAGLAKVALAIHHGQLPPNLHLQQVNPDIELEGTRFRLARALQSWGPAHAAVSSFGFGGTNAHAILGPVASAQPEPAAAPARLLVPISAASRESFFAHVEQLRELVLAGAVEPADLAYTLAARTTHHAWRGHVLTAASPEPSPAGLAAALTDVYPTRAPSSAPRVVFLCAGQGGQWLGMGQALAAWSPVFRATLERCEAAIFACAGWRLSEALASKAALERVDRVQPAIFAMQVALAQLWRSVGVEPDVVLGTSMGEVAAAAISGLLSLEDAARVITTRSRIVAEHLDTPGAMATVALSEADMRERLAARRSDLEIAVVNSPTNVVIAGSPAPLVELLAELDGEGVFARRIQVDYASHCSHVDPLAALLEAQLQGLEQPSEAPRARMLSTVTLDWLEAASAPSYWQDNLRKPVLLWRALSEVLRPAGDVILELSPHPVLTVPLEDPLAALEPAARLSCGMARDAGPEAFLDALGRVWALGVQPRWEAVWEGHRGRVTGLPSYPWMRRHYGPRVDLGDPRAGHAVAPIARADVEAPAPALTHTLTAIDVEALVVATLTHELGASEALPMDVPLRDLGLDSLMASRLRARLVDRGFELPLLEVMQAPGIAALVAKLRALAGPSLDHDSAPARSSAVGITRGACFVRPRPRPQADQLLYCFPYGGGAASTYRHWGEAMPAWIEVRNVEPPGRGTRFGEPLPRQMDTLVAELGEALLDDLDDRPFSFYGQCSGALVAYELIHQLRASGRAPRHFFTAASNSPSRYKADLMRGFFDDSKRDELGDTPILAFLRLVEFQGLADLEGDAELRDLAFETIRADSRMLLDYKARARTPLEVPITAIGGGRDPTTNAYEQWLWARETSARFDWRWLASGNHFFHIDHEAQLAALFEQVLRVETLPEPHPTTSAALDPVNVVRSFYAAFSDDPAACARFAAADARWWIHGPEARELEGERPWLGDPRVGLRSIGEGDLAIHASEEVGDTTQVHASASLQLEDQRRARHTARYRVRDGAILAAEVSITLSASG
ncbi:type I polyketide synthase [Enhygromyxa salina]|nr:type I polyketide synthase [Enhygromyxa salina]